MEPDSFPNINLDNEQLIAANTPNTMPASLENNSIPRSRTSIDDFSNLEIPHDPLPIPQLQTLTESLSSPVPPEIRQQVEENSVLTGRNNNNVVSQDGINREQHHLQFDIH